MKKLVLTLSLVGIMTAVYAQDENQESPKPERSKPKNMFTRKDFGINLGLNMFEQPNQMPDLQPWGSRYVALDFRRNDALITGRQVDVAVGSGLQVAWNNYRFEDNVRLGEDGQFQPLGFAAEKTKLTVARLELPLVLQFGFKESGFRLGVGAYAGVRVGSYQMVQRTDSRRSAERFHDSYNLNPFSYGLMAEAGRRNLRIFVKYDMTPTFQPDSPVQGTMWAAGIRF